MATLTYPYNFTPATTAKSAEVNANFTAVATLLNSTGLDSANLQANAVVTATITDLAVTTAKINDLGVTAGKIAADAVITAKILDSNVTTAKIAAGAVTQVKRAALGQSVSSTGGIGTSSTSFVDVTNLSVGITTTGRPVFIGCMSDGSADGGYVNSASGGGAAVCKFVRDSTDVAFFQFAPLSGTSQVRVPSSSMWYIDTPAAGTYTYKVQMKVASGTGAVNTTQLIAYEL